MKAAYDIYQLRYSRLFHSKKRTKCQNINPARRRLSAMKFNAISNDG